ncbi:conserved hypothetical protein [Histoplasma capsulatum var. duboisii H88]|uniref:Uncharacterized protein n=1 Tax=Ajellomyces capsulatus (strain H88) TaxID=544711 RepID=F0UMN2_AJEC8|nr:conserved hypothetical protein [Histoplasma capsulatum var. duboisii H88]
MGCRDAESQENLKASPFRWEKSGSPTAVGTLIGRPHLQWGTVPFDSYYKSRLSPRQGVATQPVHHQRTIQVFIYTIAEYTHIEGTHKNADADAAMLERVMSCNTTAKNLS